MSQSKWNGKMFTSASIAVFFFIVSITGILMFAIKYNAIVSSLHVVAGFLFLGFAFFHIRNNFGSLKSYLTNKSTKGKYKKERRWVFLSVLLIPFFTLIGLPPFSTFVEFGVDLRKTNEAEKSIYYQLDLAGASNNFTLDVVTGESYRHWEKVFLNIGYTVIPQMAVWLEDEQGNFVQTLYVSGKSSKGEWIDVDNPFFSEKVIRRPEALPIWSHKRGKKESDGLYMPTPENPLVDGISAATPLGSFSLATNVNKPNQSYLVNYEINRSYDWNEHWSFDKFPDDFVYNDGSNGQPSLLYQGMVDFSIPNQAVLLDLKGHGHYSGKDGKLYTDLSGHTTALEMVKRVIAVVSNRRD